MVCLVDTCGWIEWLTDDVLADAFEPLITADDHFQDLPEVIFFSKKAALIKT